MYILHRISSELTCLRILDFLISEIPDRPVGNTMSAPKGQLLSISKRSVEYLVATRQLSTRRIGARALIPIEEVRKYARFDHPERLAG